MTMPLQSCTEYTGLTTAPNPYPYGFISQSITKNQKSKLNILCYAVWQKRGPFSDGDIKERKNTAFTPHRIFRPQPSRPRFSRHNSPTGCIFISIQPALYTTSQIQPQVASAPQTYIISSPVSII